MKKKHTMQNFFLAHLRSSLHKDSPQKDASWKNKINLITTSLWHQIEDFTSEARALLEDVRRAGLRADETTIYVDSYNPVRDTHNRSDKHRSIWILTNNVDRPTKHALLLTSVSWQTFPVCGKWGDFVL